MKIGHVLYRESREIILSFQWPVFLHCTCTLGHRQHGTHSFMMPLRPYSFVLDPGELRVPWTTRRNQSILKEISPQYPLEGLMLKLKFQYLATRCKELTHWKRPWCWERLKVEERDDRGKDGWMASPTWWTWVWASSRSWWQAEKPGVLQFMGSQRVGHNWVTELTELNMWVGIKGRSVLEATPKLGKVDCSWNNYTCTSVDLRF